MAQRTRAAVTFALPQRWTTGQDARLTDAFVRLVPDVNKGEASALAAQRSAQSASWAR